MEQHGLKPWNTFKIATKGLHIIKHDHVNFPKYRIKYYKKLKEGQNWKNLPKSLQKEGSRKFLLCRRRQNWISKKISME